MYGKVFDSIFDSTLVADGGWLPTYIFMSLITLADKDGMVTLAPKALYRRLGLDDSKMAVEFSEFQEAIKYLCSDDSASNSTEFNGRRIVPLAEMSENQTRGWWLVNYSSYSKIARKRDSQEATNKRVAAFRERKKQDANFCNAGETPCNAPETGSNETATDETTHVDVNVDSRSIKRHTSVSPPDEPQAASPCKPARTVSVKEKAPPCPHEEIIDLWHEVLPELPRVVHSRWSGAKKTNLQARWREDKKHQNLNFWRQFFGVIRTNDHWMTGSDTKWRPTLEWFVKRGNFDKVYDRAANQKKGAPNAQSIH